MGLCAHQSKPKKRREFRRKIQAKNIKHALRIFRKLKGVKRGDFCEIRLIR